MPHRWRGDVTIDTQCFFTKFRKHYAYFLNYYAKTLRNLYADITQKYLLKIHIFTETLRNTFTQKITQKLCINYANRLRKIRRYYKNTFMQS